MRVTRYRPLGVAASIVVSLGLAARAPAQAEPPAGDRPQVEALPTPEEVFARYAEGMGGQDRLDAVQIRRMSGSYEGEPFRFPARLVVWQARPDRVHMRISQPGSSTIEIGYDGAVAWQRMPDGSVVDLGGARLRDIARSSHFWGELAYQEKYTRTETVAFFDLEGTPSVVVDGFDADDRRTRLFFHRETGLLLRRLQVAVGSDGKPVTLDMTFEDYREFDGVMFPTRVVQQARRRNEQTQEVEQLGKTVFKYNTFDLSPEGEHSFAKPE